MLALRGTFVSWETLDSLVSTRYVIDLLPLYVVKARENSVTAVSATPLLNTEHRKVQLPESRVLRLNEILQSPPKEKKRVSKIFGTRCWVSYGQWFSQYRWQRPISALYRALQRSTGRIRLKQMVHDELGNWCWLTRDIHSEPTSWEELVEKTPT